MTHTIRQTRIQASSPQQKGLVLIIALIMLAAMSLAGISLFRQINTGIVIAGNLTFKQAATTAADQGIEAGRNWLRVQAATTLQDAAIPGYFPGWCHTRAVALGAGITLIDSNNDGIDDNCSTLTADFDPTTFDWTNFSVLVTSDDGAKNEIRWVAHRLCQIKGAFNAAGQQCVTTPPQAAEVSPDDPKAPPSNVAVYYRITARSVGPRNTVSYTQAIIY